MPRHRQSSSTSSREKCVRNGRSKHSFKDLYARFNALKKSSDPHARGYELEVLFTELLNRSGLPTFSGFRRNSNGEQIDLAFSLNGWFYLTECRWVRKPLSVRAIDGLSMQVARSGKQTMGLLLAVNGWADDVPSLLQQNQDKGILLMDGTDLEAVLDGRVGMKDLLFAKLAALNLRGLPFVGADAILKQQPNWTPR
jgi:hypothetical protein